MTPARLTALFGLVAAAALTLDAPGEVTSTVLAARATGWLTLVALGLSLGIRPLRRGLGSRWRRWRRALGLAAAVACTVHVGWTITQGWVPEMSTLITEPALRSGATAALVLCALAITSFPAILRVMKFGHWPILHRAIYPAAALAVHHAMLSPHADPRALVAAAATLAGLLLLRLRRAD